MNLYKLARAVSTINALASGDPKKMRRRAKNIVVGRALGKVGFWRWLWR